MNLFVKKNIVLVSVLSVSAVVALVLLVFIAIASFGLFETFSDIAKVKVDVAAQVVHQQPQTGEPSRHGLVLHDPPVF